MTARARLIPLMIALLLGAARAHAQDVVAPGDSELHKPDDRTAAADALFREGLDLMKAGKHAEACAKFSASHRFDPSVGALLNLGNCQEKLGQLAVAFDLFVRAAEQARAEGDDKRASYAEERKDRLQDQLAWLVVEIPEKARVNGLEILRDSTAIAERWWNRRAPIDPGTWTIRARAPGARPFATRIEVERAGQEVAVRIPVLQPVAPEPGAADPDGSANPGKGLESRAGAGRAGRSGVGGPNEIAVPSAQAEPREQQAQHDQSGMPLSRKLALGSGAAGAVALIGGSVLGWRARGLYADARGICDNDDVESCTEDERRRSQAGREDARSTANLATVAFAVGAAALAAGVILWVVEPGAPDASTAARGSTRIQPVLGPGGAGVQVHVRF